MARDYSEFLIDQFNKYASWSVSQRVQLQVSASAMVFACCALIVVVYNLYIGCFLLTLTIAQRVAIVASIFVFISIVLLIIVYRILLALRDHRRNTRVLSWLMKCLREKGSLPDRVTFDVLLDPTQDPSKLSA